MFNVKKMNKTISTLIAVVFILTGTSKITKATTTNNNLQKTEKTLSNTAKEVKDLAKNQLPDGTYTIGFDAYKIDDPKQSSMLGNFFDEKIKAVVKGDKITITMLNTAFADGLYDVRMGFNGVFPESVSKKHGKPNVNGQYTSQTFEMSIPNLTSEYVCCALAGPMGAKRSDIGNMDKYKKAKIVFKKNYTLGWNGFNADNLISNDEKKFNKALIDCGLDIDADGYVSDKEISSAKGVIDLCRKDIKDISRLKNLGSNVTELHLVGNQIEELPKGIFDGLTGLKQLHIRGNGIKQLPEDIFAKLTNLTNLSIGQNNFSELPENIFKNLKNLKSFDMTGTEIEELPHNIFKELTQLENLYLYENNLKKLPSSIGNLKNLQNLSFRDNKIEELPLSLNKLTKLTSIDLSKNRIAKISDDFYKNLKNLTYLGIWNNELTYIPDNIEYLLPNLRTLNFTLNNLEKVPNISQKWIDSHYENSLKTYPQKYPIQLKLSAENNKISWTQQLSVIDILCWARTIDTIFAKEKMPTNTKEFKEHLNGRTSKQILSSKGYDWKVTTSIQKKNSNGDYITIKTIINENNEDKPDTFNDKNMKLGDEYRLIKDVNITYYGSETSVFSHLAKTKVTKVTNKKTPNKDNIINGLYDISVDVLQENNDKKSMASSYLEKVNYEVKNGKKYIIINLNRIDWMKNIIVTVDGKKITPSIFDIITTNNGEKKGKLKFEIENLDSKIKLHMNVIPMNNSRVGFRLILQKNTVKLIKEYSKNNNKNNDKNSNSKDQITKSKKNTKTKSNYKDKTNKKSSLKNTHLSSKISTNEKELPKTGSPFGNGFVTILGFLLSALGVVLMKKNKTI